MEALALADEKKTTSGLEQRQEAVFPLPGARRWRRNPEPRLTWRERGPPHHAAAVPAAGSGKGRRPLLGPSWRGQRVFFPRANSKVECRVGPGQDSGRGPW